MTETEDRVRLAGAVALVDAVRAAMLYAPDEPDAYILALDTAVQQLRAAAEALRPGL